MRFEGFSRKTLQLSPNIIPLSSIPFEELCEYDKPFFPDDRKDFLKCWINQPESSSLALKQFGALKGYGVIRKCRTGFKIGPLFADSPKFAEELFDALTVYVPEGSHIFIDTPEVNKEAVEMAKRHGMTPSFETARMYRGTCPDLPTDRIFSVTTFELG